MLFLLFWTLQFIETTFRDYEADSVLDEYDIEELSQGSYQEMNPLERRQAEEDMAERDWKEGKRTVSTMGGGTRLPSALMEEEDFEEGEEDDIRKARRKRYRDEFEDEDDGMYGISDEEEDSDDDMDVELIQPQGSLKEYILTAGRHAIAKKFRQFLRTYSDETTENIYMKRLIHVCDANKISLEVSWVHLSKSDEVPLLASWVVEAPAEILPIFHKAAFDEAKKKRHYYHKITKEFFVRISDLPVADPIRDLRQSHLNTLIRACGVVTRRTTVYPQLILTKYDCGNCGFVLGPYSQENTTKEVRPQLCSQCQSPGPFHLNIEQTVYRNYQKITLQESPGSVPPGRLPRSKEVVLLNDLVDTVRPGDEIEVTGIYKNKFDYGLNTKQGFPVFRTIIEANFVFRRDNLYDNFHLTEEDEKAIRLLAKDERIGEKIVQSIAPSIFGHKDIKYAIALAIFGGEQKNLEGHYTRGDINVLLVGDPGTAKSQFLKYVEKIAHRAVYTTGQGASAVGLTAAVRKDPVTREFTLEGGALVLADRGVCMIDEFDKMNDKDRTSIHEAMEQQSISISKAGIVTTLRARCSVIAASNPIRGRYESSLPLSKNIELSDAILSRFDITLVVRDQVSYEYDHSLAEFVTKSHVNSHPDNKKVEKPSSKIEGPISQEMLRKYIMYARANIHPTLTESAKKISTVYREMRSEGSRGGVPMTMRHVEAMIRMSEAHAKMHLRTEVNDKDVDIAIRIMLSSFIDSQKINVAQEMRAKFRKFLV